MLAHISEDEHMIQAFQNDEDIHKQAASKVLNIPIEEVTHEQRSSAKAVNFGIVYGISDFGLAGQLGISRKQAKEYIDIGGICMRKTKIVCTIGPATESVEMLKK